MEFFTDGDFADMKITKMVYDEETRGWSFFVEHNTFTYSLRDFTLPHPDDVSDEGYIVSVVKEKMLSVQNKSTKEEVKRKIEVQSDILETPISDLSVVDYVKPEEPQFLEYDGPGYGGFFLDDYDIYKGNINIILNLNSNTWIPGRYMKSLDWSQNYDYRIVNIKGNKIKLYPIDRISEPRMGEWEYWDGTTSNNLEFNGMITRDMLIGIGAISKLNVHLLLDNITMTWNYGPDNQDYDWLGEGRQIYIQGIGVSLGNKQNTEGGYSWERL
jgi:hypothetical protein